MRGAARAHIVLRVDLEKPKFRTRVEDRLEMLGLEAYSDASGAERLKGTMVRDGHGFLQGLASRLNGIGDFAGATRHVTSRVNSCFEQNISPDL